MWIVVVWQGSKALKMLYYFLEFLFELNCLPFLLFVLLLISGIINARTHVLSQQQSGSGLSEADGSGAVELKW